MKTHLWMRNRSTRGPQVNPPIKETYNEIILDAENRPEIAKAYEWGHSSDGTDVVAVEAEAAQVKAEEGNDRADSRQVYEISINTEYLY